MRTIVVIVSICAFLCCASSPNRATTPLETALHKLGESLVESCPICVQQLRKEAFTILNKEFPSGKIITSDGNSFISYSGQTQSILFAGTDVRKKGKSDAGIAYELPFVVFRYHTAANHMAGIAAADYTDAKYAAQLASFASEKKFFGTIQIIPFRYGEGNSFTYSSKENLVIVHCKVMRIEPANN